MSRIVPLPVRSAVPEMAWPAVPDAKSAQLLALLWQFGRTERWPAEALRAAQFS
jgi:hypothetical protein